MKLGRMKEVNYVAQNQFIYTILVIPNQAIMIKVHVVFCLLFVSAFTFSFNAAGQNGSVNYFPYYQLINQAEVLETDGKKNEALETYLKAFRTYTGFENDYTNAVRLSSSLKVHDKTYWLLKEKAEKTGWFSEELFNGEDFKIFKNSKQGCKYVKEFDGWLVLNERSYKVRDVRLLASIDGTDQMVRNRTLAVAKNVIGNDSIYRKAAAAIMNETDMNNYIRFRQYCLDYGFPSRFNLGGKDLFSNSFIIHVFQYTGWGKDTVSVFEKQRFIFLDSMLRKQIETGAYHPERFAYCMDYSLHADSISLYALPHYYRDEKGLKYINYPVIDPEHLNFRRAQIGLMPIEDQCRINNVPLPPNYVKK